MTAGSLPTRDRPAVAGRLGECAPLPVPFDLLGAAAVVGQEQDERVAPGGPTARSLSTIRPDTPIHPLDLGRVDGHAPRLPVLVGGHPPRRLPADREGVSGHRASTIPRSIIRRCRSSRRASQPRRVRIADAGDVLGGGVQRPVGRRVGDVEEERAGRRGELVEGVDGGLGGDRVGEEVARPRGPDRLVVADQRDGVVVAGGPVDDAVEMVEAPPDAASCAAMPRRA